MDITDCLFQWLKTFEPRGNCNIPIDLCDGVSITHALVKIDQDHFPSSLLSKIEVDCGNSWFLRVANLRRIYLCIVDFYGEVLDRTIPEKLQPDLELIARDYDPKHLCHLLQLILGCAINCPNKGKHIEVMTKLSLEVKQGLKIAIDELENFEDSSIATIQQPQSDSISTRTYSSEEFSKLQEELNTANMSRERTTQRCIELETIIDKLKEERQNLKVENEKLSDRLSSKLNPISTESTLRFDSIEHENLFQRLNNQINLLQVELTRMEEQREDYRINLEIKEKEYRKLVLQLEQLQSKLNEFKNDRDELDRLRYLNEEIIKYKNINEVQKKKLEDFNELKKQIKLLEDRNSSLIKQTFELEEEKKSMSVYKGQLELIKKQRDDLRSKANEECFRADKAEDELKRVYKKFDTISHEKEKLQVEIANIKLEMASNKLDPMQGPSIDMDLSRGLSSNITHIMGASSSTPSNNNQLLFQQNENNSEYNEKLIRLQFENDKLKKELLESNDEKIRILESQLDDERSRIVKLESEKKCNNQRIIELEGHINDLELSTNHTSQSTTNNQSIEMLKLKNRIKEMELDRLNLVAQIEKKNEELTEKEERFKKHVTKAKETLVQVEQLQAITHNNSTNIGSKNSSSLPDTSKVVPPGADDTCYWKNLITQKDGEIEKMKHEYDKANSFRDMEERLMTIGFHNLSFHLQRKSAEDRIYSSNFSQSTFLSRQRQASSRKFIIPQSDTGE